MSATSMLVGISSILLGVSSSSSGMREHASCPKGAIPPRYQRGEANAEMEGNIYTETMVI